MQTRFKLFALFAALLPVALALLAAEPEPPARRSREESKVTLPDLKPEQYADAKTAAATADALEKTYAGKRQPEAVRMLLAVLRGSHLGSQDGWFGPAENRYTWKWLTAKCGAEESV